MTSLVTTQAGEGAGPAGAYSDHFVPQRYEEYDASAHDVWREVVQRNERLVRTHRRHVHPAYAEGLDALRLPRKIPRLEDLNDRLQGTGWRIVAVDGYIPTSAYVGLMAQSVFPVSRAVRRPVHIDFAPAPDLVHDVLGHLPLLFSKEHRDFLRRLAGVMGRAASNELDAKFFDAARHLADVMSDPVRCTREGPVVEERMRSVNAALESNASELTQLRRMYVWSIEFGLLGDPADYRVHGAALLSSPAEFVIACGPGAPVVPYSLDVIHHENAFSEPVAQYFVARDVRQLTETLVSYERGMSRKPPEDMRDREAFRSDREEGRSDHA